MTKNIYTNDVKLDTIFFIGPQGSGKGTQARMLAERLGFFYWEMGGILREVAQEDSDLGREVQQQIDRGVLLQDELLLRVAADRLMELPKDQGIIFDGIPRRIGQAEFLMKILKEQGRQNFATIFIDVPHDESVNRLMLRSHIENRKDDTREGIEFRLEQYQADTIPVLDYLRPLSNYKFIEIDGRPPISEVTTLINTSLGI